MSFFSYSLRRIFLVLPCSFLFVQVQAQQLQLLLDPLNPHQQQSLFSLSLLNPTGYSGQVTIKATLKNRRGKILMIQESRQQLVANETKNLRGGDIEYTTGFIDATFNEYYGISKKLPPQNYILCVEAIAIGDQKTTSQECVDYQASDFINLIAVYPPEEEEISDQRPVFNWMNLDPTTNYTYDFRLVELEKGQNKNAALRRNNPIVAVDNISGNQYTFPADAQNLENGKEYAWQLAIKMNGESISRTDAFSFSYKDSEQYIEIPRNLSYVDITEIEGGANLYAVGEFKFKFPSDVENSLSVELFEQKTNKKKKVELPENSFTVKKGVNKFELDLKEQVYLKHLKPYQVNIKDNQSGKTYSFLITYVNPDFIK